jgi:hypothetical protein
VKPPRAITTAVPALHPGAGAGSSRVHAHLVDLLERSESDVGHPDARRVLGVTLRAWLRTVNDDRQVLDHYARGGLDPLTSYALPLPPPSSLRGLTGEQIHRAVSLLDHYRWLLLVKGAGDLSRWRAGHARSDCIPFAERPAHPPTSHRARRNRT